MSIVEMTTGDIKSPQRLARMDISVVMAVDRINNGRCIRHLCFYAFGMSVIIYRCQRWRHPDRFEEYKGGVLCLNTFGFGTTEQLYEVGYPIIKHSPFPFPDSKATYPAD